MGDDGLHRLTADPDVLSELVHARQMHSCQPSYVLDEIAFFERHRRPEELYCRRDRTSSDVKRAGRDDSKRQQPTRKAGPKADCPHGPPVLGAIRLTPLAHLPLASGAS